jgi:methionyl-tRNA formyltransferase
VNGGLRLGFAGTPEFAATILKRLLEAGYAPVVVFTQPDRASGRGRKLKPSPVKNLALDQGIEIRDPPTLENLSLRDDALDLLIVASYGLILPRQILDAPRYGCLNVHASLLPRWRGAAPVERAMMAGDQQTGVCLMQMDEGLDTGPVYACSETDITPEDTGAILDARLAELGATLLLEYLPRIPAVVATPQPNTGATYAKKLTVSARTLDWAQPATTIARQIQALAERLPVTVYGPGVEPAVRIRLLEARSIKAASTESPGTIVAVDKNGLVVACATDNLLIMRLQLDRGKGRPQSALDAVNGYPDIFAPGLCLLA